VCGYNFEDEQETKDNGANSEEQQGNTSSEDESENKNGQNESAKGPDAEEDVEEEMVECTSCYEWVRKGPRCPVCKVPFNF
jgi:hypothetical protein